MSEIRWAVYPDLIPLNGRPTAIGEVMAPDKATALERAAIAHGSRIVVQSVASRKCAERELVLPLRATKTRAERVTIARLNAERTRRRRAKREQAEAASEPPTAADNACTNTATKSAATPDTRTTTL